MIVVCTDEPKLEECHQLATKTPFNSQLYCEQIKQTKRILSINNAMSADGGLENL